MWKIETNRGLGQGYSNIKSWEKGKQNEEEVKEKKEEATNFTNYFFCSIIHDLTKLLNFGKYNCNLLGYRN